MAVFLFNQVLRHCLGRTFMKINVASHRSIRETHTNCDIGLFIFIWFKAWEKEVHSSKEYWIGLPPMDFDWRIY